MKIAFAVYENHVKSSINEQFGRTDWFCIYDTVEGTTKYVENTKRNFTENAGIESAKFLFDFEISMIVAGRFGSKVVDLFQKNEIQMIIPENEQNLSYFIKLFQQKKEK